MFLFTDPEVGQQHGYFGGWAFDDCFDYTREGQRGDQQFIQGNRAVLEHREQHRALQIFHGVTTPSWRLPNDSLDEERSTCHAQ